MSFRSPPAAGEKTLVYHACRHGTGLWLRSANLLSVRGREHLPQTGGILAVANHQSFLDIPVLANAIPRHVAFVARDSLADSRCLAFIMRECGAILLRRGQADRGAIRAILTNLEAGDCVAVFPEGTRSVDGRLGEFRGGALLAARKARVPILPVAIEGAGRALPRGARFPRPGRIRVTIAEPIPSNSEQPLEAARSEIARILGQNTGAQAQETAAPGISAGATQPGSR